MNRVMKHIEIIVVLSLVLLVFAWIRLSMLKGQEKAFQARCMSSQRQIALAINMWTMEHQNKLPPAKNWASTLKVEERLFFCPSLGEDHNCYGYNFAIGGKKLEDIKSPATTLLTADCKSSVADNILRTPADFDPRHNGKVICSYVDGHVELTTAPAKIK